MQKSLTGLPGPPMNINVIFSFCFFFASIKDLVFLVKKFKVTPPVVTIYFWPGHHGPVPALQFEPDSACFVNRFS